MSLKDWSTRQLCLKLISSRVTNMCCSSECRPKILHTWIKLTREAVFRWICPLMLLRSRLIIRCRFQESTFYLRSCMSCSMSGRNWWLKLSSPRLSTKYSVRPFTFRVKMPRIATQVLSTRPHLALKATRTEWPCSRTHRTASRPAPATP